MRFTITIVFTLLASGFVLAGDPINVQHGPLDQATLQVGKISRDAPVHVYLFDTSNVKMGKAKHKDTARLMAGTVPHLLAVDIVEGMRDSGFSKVILEESTATEVNLSSGEMALLGRFTELNPGSQATRQWIGLGAGKSKVCIKGRLVDSNNKSLGEFSDCRNGLGWGNSAAELDNSTESIGDDVANLLTGWANGNYAK